MGEPTRLAGKKNTPSYLNYTTVSGFFLQDDPSTDASTFDYASTNLGLINRTYPTDGHFDPRGTKTQWQRLEHYVNDLNKNCDDSEDYKVLYLGRHGEGYHNVAEAFYGTPAWDCYWSELNGNGTISWADARLTPKGETQALVANAFWKEALVKAKVPAPQAYYSSPLDRCLATANLTFGGLELPAERPFKPVIKELLREALGIHTCDRRSMRTEIHSRFPDFAFENGFAENDPLWVSNLRESDPHLDARITKLLDDIFTHDANTHISLTSHSGAIGGILRAIGHISFGLQTGGIIPVLIKAEMIKGEAPTTSIASGMPAPTCTANPIGPTVGK